MTRGPDLVVIGGGPAGLGIAIGAARRGVRTLLVERRALPHDKPCGEGLLPNVVEALRRLDIDRAAIDARSTPLRGIRYIAPSGRSIVMPFAADPGAGMRRIDLSALLVARARGEPALEVIDQQIAHARFDADGPLVTAGGRTWRPRLVVAADGLQSSIRTAARIETTPAGRQRWGLRQHFAGPAWTDEVEVYFGQGCEAYVTPVPDGVNIAWLWDVRGTVRDNAADADAGPGLDAQATAGIGERLLACVPALAPKLRGRAREDRARGAGPFRQRPVRRAARGVLLAGDAAGYLDPLTGEGVGLALAQAASFEHHVVPLLLAAGPRVVHASALRRHLRTIDRAARPNRDLTRVMLRLTATPARAERFVRALAGDPGLLAHGLRVTMGRASLWQTTPGALVRLAATMARR